MSKELRGVDIAFTVHSVEHLPEKNGEQMYADDVVAEVQAVVEAAVGEWYARRGQELLASEPLIG